MKPDMNIAHLRTLVAIDEEGSFNAAAEKIGRTQSAVTQQMKSLEQIVGMPLFLQKGRRRKMSAAGQTLLNYSREILALSEQAIKASVSSQSIGVVRLGAPLEIANDLLPGILNDFADSWPGIRVFLHIDRSQNLMKMLKEGQLDLTLSTWRTGGHEGKRIKLLPVHWIAASRWKFDHKKPLPLILTDEPSIFRRIGLSALDLSGKAYYERLTTPNPAGVRFAIEAGLGITARTTTTFRSDIQLLGPETGLPPLPQIAYYLHKSRDSDRPELEIIYKAIVKRASDESVLKPATSNLDGL